MDLNAHPDRCGCINIKNKWISVLTLTEADKELLTEEQMGLLKLPHLIERVADGHALAADELPVRRNMHAWEVSSNCEKCWNKDLSKLQQHFTFEITDSAVVGNEMKGIQSIMI